MCSSNEVPALSVRVPVRRPDPFEAMTTYVPRAAAILISGPAGSTVLATTFKVLHRELQRQSLPLSRSTEQPSGKSLECPSARRGLGSVRGVDHQTSRPRMHVVRQRRLRVRVESRLRGLT
jgi:hypothetical protein